MDVTADRPTCPFCTFSVMSNDSDDMYFLMQHLELYHPENGQSPFTTLDEGPGLQLLIRSGRGSMISTETPSEDNQEDYVECPVPCGETLTYAELSSHMELHAAEEDVLDEEDAAANFTDPQTVQRRIVPRPDKQIAGFSSEVLLDPAKQTDVKLSKKHRHSHGKRKDHHGIKEWKDLLIGSPLKKTRTSDAKAKHVTARRLGVCMASFLCHD